MVNKANETEEIPFGACVWATGVAMNPLIKIMQEKLPGQNHFRCGLQVTGSVWYCPLA